MGARDRAREREAREQQQARQLAEPSATATIPPQRTAQQPTHGFDIGGIGSALQGTLSGFLDAGAEAADGFGALMQNASGQRQRSQAFRERHGQERIPVLSDLADFDVFSAASEAIVPALTRWGLMGEGDGDILPNAPRLVETPDNVVGQLSDGIAQFVTGYVTLGRVLGPVANGSTALQIGGRGMAQGAAVDFAVFDGNEARLSNLLRDWAGLRDPVTEFLAANEDDPEIEGRLKNVFEGAGLGLIFEGFFAGLRAMRAQRRLRAGQATEADLEAAARQVEEASLADAERVRSQANAQAARDRRAAIDSQAEERISRTTNETSIEANESEARAMSAGTVDPTKLTPRQERALETRRTGIAQIEEQRARAHEVEDFRELVQSGDTPRILQAVQEWRAKANPPREAPVSREWPDMGELQGMRQAAEELSRNPATKSRNASLATVRASIERLEREQREWTAPPKDQAPVAAYRGPAPPQVVFARGGEEANIAVNADTGAAEVGDSAGNAFPAADFKAVFDTQRNRIVLHPARTRPARAAPDRLAPTRTSVSIVPGERMQAEDYITAARAQAARMLDKQYATTAEGTASSAEAHRLADLTTQLEEAASRGHIGSVNKLAAQIQAHLDDEALAQVHRKRPESEAINERIGQTNESGTTRARGNKSPETVEVDEAFTRSLAEHFSKGKDVASATVRTVAEAWNDGHLPTRSVLPNLDAIATEDGVKAFIVSFSDMAEAGIRNVRGETKGNAAAGVRSDAQRDAITRALAKDIGTDAGTLMARLAEMTGSTAHLDSKLQAVRVAHVTAADAAQQQMRAFLADQSQENLSRALTSLQAFAATHTTLKGSTSEIARALRTLRTTVSPDKDLLSQFASIVDEGVVRQLDPSGGSTSALDALQRLAGAVSHVPNRRGLARLFEPKFSRAVEDYYTSSILSAPPAHVMNIFDNAFNAITTPVERMLGGIVGRNPEVMQEAVDHSWGLLATSREAWRFAGLAWKNNRTYLDNTFEQSYQTNFRAESFGVNPDKFFGRTINSLGKVIGVIPRFLGSQDEFFKQLNYRSQLYANGLREARAAGIKHKDALRTYVTEYVAAGFDGNGHSIRAPISPDQASLINNANDRALRTARRNTYTEPSGPIMGRIEAAIRKVPYGRLVIPFFRTPVNIVKYAWRRSPGAFLSESFRADVLGKNGLHAQEQAHGQMALATIAYGTAISYAMAGQITGRGPSDPAVRRHMVEAGWAPYSIKIGNDYIPYSRLGGLGITLGVVADNVELANEQFVDRPDDPLEVGGVALVHLAQMLRDKTFFKGIDTVLSAFDRGPEEQEIADLQRLIANYAGAAVPSAIARASADGYMREPRGALDAMAARLPFAREGVDMRRNFLGEPANTPAPLMVHDFISPFTVSRAGEDNVLTEIARVAAASNGGLQVISRKVDRTGVDLTEFRSQVNGRSAHDRLQEIMAETQLSGRTLRESLSELINSNRYQTALTDGEVEDGVEARGSRITAIQRVRRTYYNAAIRQVRTEIPELDTAIREAQTFQRDARRPDAGNTNRNAEGLPNGLEWLAGSEQ